MSSKHKAMIRQTTLEKKNIQDKKALRAAIRFARRVEGKFCDEYPCLARLIKASKVMSIFAKANDIPEEETAENADVQEPAQNNLNSQVLADGYNVLAHNEASPAAEVNTSNTAVSSIASAVAAATESKLDVAALFTPSLNEVEPAPTSEIADSEVVEDVVDAEDAEDDFNMDSDESPALSSTYDQATYAKDGYLVLKRNIPDFKNSLSAMFRFINATQSDKKAIYAQPHHYSSAS